MDFNSTNGLPFFGVSCHLLIELHWFGKVSVNGYFCFRSVVILPSLFRISKFTFFLMNNLCLSTLNLSLPSIVLALISGFNVQISLRMVLIITLLGCFNLGSCLNLLCNYCLSFKKFFGVVAQFSIFLVYVGTVGLLKLLFDKHFTSIQLIYVLIKIYYYCLLL